MPIGLMGLFAFCLRSCFSTDADAIDNTIVWQHLLDCLGLVLCGEAAPLRLFSVYGKWDSSQQHRLSCARAAGTRTSKRLRETAAAN